ncbi:MAG: hypothetical protein AB7O97_12965 [Planctomycetota bacterium]
MNTTTATRLPTLPTAALCALLLATVGPDLRAQAPKDPPPWWGNQDEDTVSLHWDFANQANPLAPTTQVLPTWYAPPPGPGMFTNSPNVGWIASLGGQSGVMGFTGGSGSISALVDNDPRPFWIKIFFMQYDSFGDVSAEIAKDLVKYERAIVSETKEPLPNGWIRTTIGMYLIPQPIDETASFAMNDPGNTTVAIDNVFVNSKCVKPPPDEEGKALGEIDAASLNIDLALATGGATCTAVAATEDQAGVLTFWVAGRTGNADAVFRLDSAGVQVGAAVPLPTAIASVEGASDLTVAELPLSPTVRRKFVFGTLDRRPANGTVAIVGIDSVLGAVAPARTVTIQGPALGVIGPGPLGLAFSRHGDGGNGTFWISDQLGNLSEVDQNGNVLRQLTPASNGLPTGLSGCGYDDSTNQFYLFSQTLRTLSTTRTSQVNGVVFDGYTLRQTGIQFFGDMTLPSLLGPPGGRAAGLSVLRRNNGDMKLLCVQQLSPTRSQLVSLNGPYQFGWSLMGRCGMRGGPPLENSTFDVTLTGVPRAGAAMLFCGVDNSQSGGVPLPLDLGGALGMDESTLLLDPLVTFPFQVAPTPRTGTFAQPVAVPPGFAGTTLFFQWLVFDPAVVLGMAASQGGETVVYPN